MLVFPCVWVQKVLQRRILGASTWQGLKKRRRELRLVGMNDTFLSFSDIITASQVHVHHKNNIVQRKQQSEELWSRVRLKVGQTKQTGDEREALSHFVKVATNSESRLSTPRKILPSM